jgi:hypothetical protein
MVSEILKIALADDYDSIETLSGAARHALMLFLEISERHGEQQARRLFLKWAKPPTARQKAEIINWSLLHRFDAMKAPNVQKMAREIAEENRSLPPEKRQGPRGSTSEHTLDKHIRRLLKVRKKALEKGTWEGPGPDYWPDYNTAKLVDWSK